MGTNFDQLDQKECQVKGRVSFPARKQILGYERPLLAQDLCKSSDRQGQATKQINKSQECGGLWVASRRLTHALKEFFISPSWLLGWFSWCCRLLF